MTQQAGPPALLVEVVQLPCRVRWGLRLLPRELVEGYGELPVRARDGAVKY